MGTGPIDSSVCPISLSVKPISLSGGPIGLSGGQISVSGRPSGLFVGIENKASSAMLKLEFGLSLAYNIL